MFKRKVYDELLLWKKEWAGKYACLLEGAHRVGKTTIAETFARNEYKSYILIDFSKVSDEEMEARRANWQPREPKVTTGYLARYASMVTSGNRGAILEIPKR